MEERVINIGINGLGRVGRHLLVRLCQGKVNGVRLMGINTLDPFSQTAFLVKHDSLYGKSDLRIDQGHDYIDICGQRIPLFQSPAPQDIPWKELGVQLVIESAGLGDKAWGHLEAGAEYCLVAGSISSPDITLSMGINHNAFSPQNHKMICGASCTTTMTAPLIKVLNDRFSLEHIFLTFVHSYTNDQTILDSFRSDLRRARSALRNIIPTTTSALKHLSDIFPHLKGHIKGTAIRVPTPLVHMGILIARLKKTTSIGEIMGAIEDASKGPLRSILGINDLPLTGVDFRGETRSCIVDKGLSSVQGNLLRLVFWHDNEIGYVSRIIDLIEYVASIILYGEKAT